MNTAIAITAIIAALLAVTTITAAVKDIAKAKHRHCPNCGQPKPEKD